MTTRQPNEPITRDAIVVLTPPADASHRIIGLLSPFDPAAASAVMGAAASLPGNEPPPPRFGDTQLLDALVAPMHRDAFVAQHWERAPVLIRAEHARPERLMFDRARLDAGIASGAYAPSAVSLSQRGQLVDTGLYTKVVEQGGRSRQVLDPARTAALLDDGGSIRVLELQTFDPQVAAMARELGGALGQRIGANVYYSAAGQGHFSAMREGIHWDTHDVFAVQTRGRKAWSVFKPVVAQPLGQHRSFYYDIPATEPLLSVVLEPGDVLYIPRGFVHQVRSPDDSDSIHLAIGVYTATWSELVDVMLRRAQLQRGHEPDWRQSVDPLADRETIATRVATMLRELADSVAALDGPALLEDAIVATQGLAPEPRGPRPSLGPHTPLVRRAGLAFVREEADRTVLKLPGRKILLPLRALAPLQRLVALGAGERCDLASLVPGLTPAEAAVLVDVLLFHGVLALDTETR